MENKLYTNDNYRAFSETPTTTIAEIEVQATQKRNTHTYGEDKNYKLPSLKPARLKTQKKDVNSYNSITEMKTRRRANRTEEMDIFLVFQQLLFCHPSSLFPSRSGRNTKMAAKNKQTEDAYHHMFGNNGHNDRFNNAEEK